MHEELIAELETAYAALAELCGGERFRMSIPVREDLDHDVRIGRPIQRAIAALRHADGHERCESGCAEPVTAHDADGVPLCEACATDLAAEQGGRETEGTA